VEDPVEAFEQAAPAIEAMETGAAESFQSARAREPRRPRGEGLPPVMRRAFGERSAA